ERLSEPHTLGYRRRGAALEARRVIDHLPGGGGSAGQCLLGVGREDVGVGPVAPLARRAQQPRVAVTPLVRRLPRHASRLGDLRHGDGSAGPSHELDDAVRVSANVFGHGCPPSPAFMSHQHDTWVRSLSRTGAWCNGRLAARGEAPRRVSPTTAGLVGFTRLPCWWFDGGGTRKRPAPLA